MVHGTLVHCEIAENVRKSAVFFNAPLTLKLYKIYARIHTHWAGAPDRKARVLWVPSSATPPLTGSGSGSEEAKAPARRSCSPSRPCPGCHTHSNRSELCMSSSRAKRAACGRTTARPQGARGGTSGICGCATRSGGTPNEALAVEDAAHLLSLFLRRVRESERDRLRRRSRRRSLRAYERQT